MFDWLKRKPDAAAPAAEQAAPTRGPALMRAIRDEVRAAAVDHQDLALAVLADIRSDPLDTCFDVTDINDWIDDYLTRAGLSGADVDKQRLRAVLKAQPGVSFKHCGIRTEDRYAGLRARLKRRRGFVPEKVWVFRISTDGYALRPQPERCGRVLIEAQAAADQDADRTRATQRPINGRLAADSGPIPTAVARSAADRGSVQSQAQCRAA